MNWKLVSLVATAAGLAQAQGEGFCPIIANPPSGSADSNFIYSQFPGGGWNWKSGTISGVTINDDGLITVSNGRNGGVWKNQINMVCVAYEPQTGSHNTCFDISKGACYMDVWNNILNAWGFLQS
jgi:hypothetical protein